MLTIATEERISEIVRRSYTREFTPNADGTWFAKIVEFPGCITQGDSIAETMANLEDAMVGWIAVHLEDGDPIPDPIDDAAFSGKFLVRVSKSLHRALARRAEIEGVSLNQLVNTQLARAVGV